MKLRSVILYSLLFVASSTLAQPRVSANTEEKNLGRIEWKKPVKIEFIITNTGNSSLVMNNVTTSCACTIADWTKEAIAPGDKGKVTATFDAEQLGHFQKEISIYSNATPHLVYLSFVGEVVKQVSDVSSSHPFKIGNIAIDRTSIEFGDAHRGDILTTTLDIVNQSDRPYEPILMHLPSSISIRRSSDVLLKGQRGIIQLSLDTKQLNDVGLQQNSIYLSRFNGDKVSPENEIPVSVIILPDFSKMTENDRMKAPVIKISTTELDLTTELASHGKVTKNITITNNGKSPLVITKLQVFNTAIGVTLKKRVLQPSETTSLKVTVHKPKEDEKSKMRILLINDDPNQPKVEINIKTQAQQS